MSKKSSSGTNNTQLQLLGAFRQSFNYCEIAMPINFIESSDARQTAAISKIYTKYVRGMFSQLCRKVPRSVDWNNT